MAAARMTERARVVRLRNALGLTQREMASEFGVAPAAVSHWESGKRPLGGPALKLLGYYESELGLTNATAEHLPHLPIGTSARRKGALEALALWSVYRYLAANADASSIGGQIRHRALERYALTASRLKGLSMKLLQMASFMDLVVDEGERQTIAEVRSRSSPMPETTMLAIFLKAFGKVPQELFASFKSRPLAVTSLGQVHEATLADGRHVVVKVQHPMMVRALKADLANVEYLDRLYSLAAGSQTPGVIFAEIRDRVLEECDYVLEARHQTLFGTAFAGRPELHIPGVIPEFSTKTVLTSERAQGISFDNFARTATPATRARAGTAIWTFVNEGLYRHGIFNADIHLDNFLFSADGRVSFLDFGRVKHLSPEYRAYQRQLTRAILERDKLACARALDAAGVTQPGFDYDTGFRLFACVFRGLLSEGPYAYSPEHLLRIWRTWTNRDAKRFRFNLKRDHVFLESFIFGGAALMARLGATVDARAVLLDLVYAPDEKRPRPYTASELAELEPT